MSSDRAKETSEIRWGKFENKNWSEIQGMIDNGMGYHKIGKILKISSVTLYKANKLGFITKPTAREKASPMSEETKKKISEKRKKFLKDNPDKHPWRNKDKFKSEPCEKVKNFLISKHIDFIAEFQPEIEDRFFSIDIAMPDKMIAIEINGNQHYERTGLLKPYYQKRHDLLIEAGWDVYEIHYGACFNLEKLEEFFSRIEKGESKVDFDYFSYLPKPKASKKKSNCIDCNAPIFKKSIRCASCQKIIRFKCKNSQYIKPQRYDECNCGNSKNSSSNRCMPCHMASKAHPNKPSKENLEKLIWQKPMTELGKMFGVSDVSIKKWCISYGVERPPAGFFLRK